MSSRVVIFTDLDGTFMGHESYSFELALSGFRLALTKGVPIVFCSSKTRAEIEGIRREVGISDPFIVENGGAIYVPRGFFPFDIPDCVERDSYRVLELGTPYAEIVRSLENLARELGLGIRGFHQMTAEEVAADCGLSLSAARLAKQREYDEPFEIQDASDDALARLSARANELGLAITKGGRYFHLLGGTDKGQAALTLSKLFRKDCPRLLTVALGDSLNDLPMLQAVDVPILVQKTDGTHDSGVVKQIPHVRLSRGVGPSGWSAAVTEILNGELRH